MLKKILLTILVSISVLFALNFKHGANSGIFHGDALGYYFYLPSTFIYHNLDSINILPNDRQIEGDIFTYAKEMAAACETPNGHILDQYTFGVAIMELPFFLGGHLYAKLTGQNMNGFSPCYQNAIRWSSIFYTILGLLILYKVIRRYFSANVSVASIFIIFIGSNLFWFALYQAGMAHIPLFFLFSLLLLLTIRLYEKTSLSRFIWVGLVCGMITYIRPVDIVCVFIPLFYNVFNKVTWKDKLAFLYAHKIKIVVAAFMCFLPWMPQMIYWKMMTGSYLYDSYKSNQTFNFLKPHIWEGITSASNGWLFYSPALIIFIPGLFLWKKYKPFASAIFIAIPIYMYLIYSWFAPNYINGFGSRPMVDVAALVALPVSAVVSYISQKKKWVIITFGMVIAFCITLSFSFMIQEIKNVSHSEYNKGTFVAQMLFRFHLTYNDLVVYDLGEKQPDIRKIKPIGDKIYVPFCDTSKNVITDSVGNKIYHITHEDEYPPIQLSLTYHQASMKNVHWIKYSGVFYTNEWADVWDCQVFAVTVERDGKPLKWSGVRINNKIGRANTDLSRSQIYEWKLNEWGEVYFYFPIPFNIKEGDLIKMGITNTGHKVLLAKDVYLQLFE